MGDILKEIFKGTGEKLRTPQVLGLIAIILLIFRFVFSLEFKSLLLIFISGLGNFGFLINFFQQVTVMLFISSVIVFIASMFNTITYLVIEKISNNKKGISKRLSDTYNNANRFFIGSKIAVVNVDMWLLVASSYFNMFDEGAFNKYKSYILSYTTNTNFLLRL